MPSPHPACTRRGFLLGTGAGLVAGAAGTAFLTRFGGRFPGVQAPRFVDRPVEQTRPALAMPGPYPGRVVEVRHPVAVSDRNVVSAPVVEQMVERGMAELTGTDPRDVRAAWGTFFAPDDVVGIKVNPVGQSTRPTAVASVSSFPLVVKVVKCLQAAGVPPRNILLFDRYADMFAAAGYAALVERELPAGVRWYGASATYTDDQLDVAGFDRGRARCSPELARHVTGYDPDVFTSMGFCMPEHSPRDDRRFRSHLSAVVTRLCTKIINLPVLKDHRSAGVTLALKNLSHGMNNNVARSHLPAIPYGFGASASAVGPNQCNTFIPQAASHRLLRERAVLHILDGLIGCYEGGPGCWNATWATWRHQGLFFATDPVAMDHVGWDIIDTKRAAEGWPPTARTGLLGQPAARFRRAAEPYNLRTPEHIILAGKLGLGCFDRNEILHTVVQLDGGPHRGSQAPSRGT